MKGIFSLFPAVCLLCSSAYGQTVFSLNPTVFESQVGQHEVFDFDSLPTGADIGGQTIDGIKFNQIGSPLLVVRAQDTFTPNNQFSGVINIDWYKLPSTSGQNILSPGGVELGLGPDIDSDSIEIEFEHPQRFFGFDHLSQSADGWSFTTIAIYNDSNSLLYNGTVPISGSLGGSGKADFWGIIFESEVITSIVITESDFNNENPDANIGIDTIRYSNAVPEPAPLGFFFALTLVFSIRTRTKNMLHQFDKIFCYY